MEKFVYVKLVKYLKYPYFDMCLWSKWSKPHSF